MAPVAGGERPKVLGRLLTEAGFAVMDSELKGLWSPDEQRALNLAGGFQNSASEDGNNVKNLKWECAYAGHGFA